MKSSPVAEPVFAMCKHCGMINSLYSPKATMCLNCGKTLADAAHIKPL